MDPVLATSSISKRFGIVHALSDVGIAFRSGDVHGLVGENGAGKSTLLKILSGVERPDAGQVLFGGKPCQLNHPLDALRLGISMIHQELNLVDELTVAENVFLGRERTTLGLVASRRSNRDAEALLKSVQCDISRKAKVKGLSIAQKQMVEIAKAISVNASVLIMDEPTAVLARPEVSGLFELIARLKRAGVSVVFVSHILPEILRICDRVTVMRDGRIVETIAAEHLRQIGERGLASKMVGREMADHFPVRKAHPQDIAIEVRGLSVPGKVRDASFSVRRG
jgi:ribose transport system ATP-binding protein